MRPVLLPPPIKTYSALQQKLEQLKSLAEGNFIDNFIKEFVPLDLEVRGQAKRHKRGGRAAGAGAFLVLNASACVRRASCPLMPCAPFAV